MTPLVLQYKNPNSGKGTKKYISMRLSVEQKWGKLYNQLILICHLINPSLKRGSLQKQRM